MIFSSRTYCWSFPCETDNYGDLILKILKPQTGRFFSLMRCPDQTRFYFGTRVAEVTKNKRKVFNCGQRPHLRLPVISCRVVEIEEHTSGNETAVMRNPYFDLLTNNLSRAQNALTNLLKVNSDFKFNNQTVTVSNNRTLVTKETVLSWRTVIDGADCEVDANGGYKKHRLQR